MKLESSSQTEKFQLSFPWDIYELDLSLTFKDSIEKNRIVLLIDADDETETPVVGKCVNLSYSETLGRWFIYAPVVDNPGLKHAGKLRFSTPIRRLTVTPITWPGSEIVGDDTVDRVVCEFKFGDMDEMGSDLLHVISAIRGFDNND